jgi:5,10-methylenetetrahydromethanopterin reductase
MALAGELADELKVGGSANPEMVAVARERLAAPDVGIVLGAVTVVAEDGSEARALARRELVLYLPVVGPLDPTAEVDPERFSRMTSLSEAGREDEAAALITDEMLDRFAFAGTPEQVAGHARDVLDAGARRVDFGPPLGIDTRAGARLLAERVAPLVLS